MDRQIRARGAKEEPGVRAREVGRGQVPPARPRSQVQTLGSLFGKTETRACISVGRRLFHLFVVVKVGAFLLLTPSLPGNNISAHMSGGVKRRNTAPACTK